MDLDDEYDSDFIQPDNEDSGYSTDSDATITTTTSSTSHHEHQESYTILSEADIYQLLDKDITRISTVLSISRASASILLQNYNWSVSKVNDTWFSDEEKVRRELGLLENQIQIVEANCQPSKRCTRELNCMICFDTYPRAKMDAAECGHSFCIACWTNYISTSICNGPGCLMLRCPDQFCKAVVGHDMINKLVRNKDKEKYSHYLVRSYVEHNRRTKWCPAPDCAYAVDFDISSSRYDINCKCSYSFCWNCTEEVHRPVDCATVAKWNLKNIDESENTNWILANTKPCPKCKRPIEKNSGCMSMTCGPPCRFRFCWLCLGAGGYHNVETCNAYKLEGGVDDETERNREMAQKHIRRYTHYYERWAVNHSSRQKALADLETMQNIQIEKFLEKGYQITQLKFITEAWLQIVECRRVLKWTYAYGYYLSKHEDAKRQLFEFLQGQAESGLERLHQCSEKELEVHLNAENPSNGFHEFRMKLTGLTKVTGNYFENLVKALENDLSDVNSQGTSSKMET